VQSPKFTDADVDREKAAVIAEIEEVRVHPMHRCPEAGGVLAGSAELDTFGCMRCSSHVCPEQKTVSHHEELLFEHLHNTAYQGTPLAKPVAGTPVSPSPLALIA
jgi:predicted Zn-dependent peptidase